MVFQCEPIHTQTGRRAKPLADRSKGSTNESREIPRGCPELCLAVWGHFPLLRGFSFENFAFSYVGSPSPIPKVMVVTTVEELLGPGPHPTMHMAVIAC